MPPEKLPFSQTRLQQTPQQPKSMCKHRQRLLKNAGLRAQRLPAAPACTLGAPHDSESYLHLHLQFLPPAWQIAVQNLPALAGATAATCMTCCRADHQCLCPGQYHPHAMLRQPEAEDRLPSSAASGNTRLRQGCGGGPPADLQLRPRVRKNTCLSNDHLKTSQLNHFPLLVARKCKRCEGTAIWL